VSKRTVITIAVNVITLLILTQYTNCSQVDGVSGLSSENIGTEIDGELRIVDNWNTKPILFAEKSLAIESTQEQADVHGICLKSSSISKIYWTIENQGGSEPYEFGEAVCERGSFTIQVADASSLPCDQDLVLLASVEGSEEFEHVQLDRHCQ